MLIVLISLTCLFLLIPVQKSVSQERYQLEELFMDAESWFYFQDYKNSLPLYLRVHEAYPDNDNINYKIGFCYLNIDGQEEKAIPYLEKAAQNTTFNFSEEAFYETEAPVDAIFYLANAYLINNQLDKALDTYNRFEEKVKNRRSIFNRADFDYEYLQKQKQACRNARELMAKPVNYTAENLGLPINTPQPEYNPIISGDGKTLIYTADKKFYTGVFMSKKENGKWGPPINLLPQLGVDGDCETTSLSYDGTEMYLYREDELDGNIYVSHYQDGQWSKIKKLGENINTKYWESHAFIAADGQTLYFTSNREGGYGDLDIYKAERNADGSWKTPQNIGKPVNTEWREDTPFLTEDGNTLFFSSEGHFNMGGFDIFVAHRTQEGWKSPQNIGYPLNTTDDDRFIVPVNQGSKAYYARFNNKAGGQKDIYAYNLENIQTTDFIDVEGIITYQSPENKIKKSFRINVINTKTNDTIAVLEPGKGPENYTYQTPTGQNHLIYETPRLSNNEQYVISKGFEIEEQYLEPKVIAEETTEKEPEPEINLERDVFRAKSTDDNIKIKLQLQGGNKLVVNTFQGGELVNTENFPIDKDSFVYEYTPEKGESRLTFNLFDDQKNILSRDVNIILDSLRKQKLADKAKLQIEGQSVSLESGQKKVKIKLSLSKGSDLFVETYVDDQLINTEKFNIKEENFTYEFEPKDEKSRLNFKVVDQRNNIKNQEIVISHKPIDSNLELLLTSVSSFSAVPLSTIIGASALAEMSTAEMLDSLLKKVQRGSIKPGQFELLLTTAAILKAKNPQDFFKELIKLADEKTKNYLSQFNTSDLNSNTDVIALLKEGVNSGNITREAYKELLKKYMGENYTPDELKILIADLSEISLDKLFNNMGQDALDIVTIEDLLKKIEGAKNIDNQTILALLESIRIQNNHYPVTVKKRTTEPQKIAQDEQFSKGFKYGLFVLVGILVFLFIIYLVKRRRKEKR